MSSEIALLAGTAATIGFLHTILGPDHYLPFIALSKARNWTATRTLTITLLCGVGHLLGSVALGFLGIGLGIAVFRLEAIESFRGELAAWILIAFGLAYSIWGIRHVIRSRPHEHRHMHDSGDAHLHQHRHVGPHTHIHTSSRGSITPWILFLIFIFGPCEPLIPLVMYPAAKGNMLSVAIVASVFGLSTIATMASVVLISFYGMARLPLHGFQVYSHAVAGFAVFLCGGAIKVFGL